MMANEHCEFCGDPVDRVSMLSGGMISVEPSKGARKKLLVVDPRRAQGKMLTVGVSHSARCEVLHAAPTDRHQPPRTGSCRSCQAPMFWITMTSTGKKMPVDVPPGGFSRELVIDEQRGEAKWLFVATSHFATCPKAKRWRAPKVSMAQMLQKKKDQICKTCEGAGDWVNCPRCVDGVRARS